LVITRLYYIRKKNLICFYNIKLGFKSSLKHNTYFYIILAFADYNRSEVAHTGFKSVASPFWLNLQFLPFPHLWQYAGAWVEEKVAGATGMKGWPDIWQLVGEKIKFCLVQAKMPQTHRSIWFLALRMEFLLR
jgi:hypothetical protein